MKYAGAVTFALITLGMAGTSALGETQAPPAVVEVARVSEAGARR